MRQIRFDPGGEHLWRHGQPGECQSIHRRQQVYQAAGKIRVVKVASLKTSPCLISWVHQVNKSAHRLCHLVSPSDSRWLNPEAKRATGKKQVPTSWFQADITLTAFYRVEMSAHTVQGAAVYHPSYSEVNYNLYLIMIQTHQVLKCYVYWFNLAESGPGVVQKTLVPFRRGNRSVWQWRKEVVVCCWAASHGEE